MPRSRASSSSALTSCFRQGTSSRYYLEISTAPAGSSRPVAQLSLQWTTPACDRRGSNTRAPSSRTPSRSAYTARLRQGPSSRYCMILSARWPPCAPGGLKPRLYHPAVVHRTKYVRAKYVPSLWPVDLGRQSTRCPVTRKRLLRCSSWLPRLRACQRATAYALQDSDAPPHCLW